MALMSRCEGIRRPYTAGDVNRLKGSVKIEHTLARNGANKLWDKLHSQPYVSALGALTGNQAMQQAKAGLDLYCPVNVSKMKAAVEVVRRESQF